MNRLVDENGVLNIEDLLQENPSFQAMIADRVVTMAEKQEQSAKIIELLRRIDEEFDDAQVELVRQLMAELSAFIYVCSNYPEVE